MTPFRPGADRRSESAVHAILDLCTDVPFDAGYWDAAAEYEKTLRSKGVTIPRDDLFIATVAMERRLILLHLDRHFELAFAAGLEVKLVSV